MTNTTAPTLPDYISNRWAGDSHERRARLDDMNYRNRNRWMRVMKAWPAALDKLVAQARANGKHIGPNFTNAKLGIIYSAVMDGTGPGLTYTLDQMVPEDERDIFAPLLREMWNGHKF